MRPIAVHASGRIDVRSLLASCNVGTGTARLPRDRLGDHAVRVGHGWRKLANPQVAFPEPPYVRRGLGQVIVRAGSRVRIDHHDPQPKVVVHVPDRAGQIGIVRHHDGLLVVPGKSADQQAGGQVHVGALLLRVPDSHVCGTSRFRPGQRAVLIRSRNSP